MTFWLELSCSRAAHNYIGRVGILAGGGPPFADETSFALILKLPFDHTLGGQSVSYTQFGRADGLAITFQAIVLGCGA
ncbi:hypothetical protein DdX_14896 [Ditylenchus destructor]|uniref:Uncharacterized protein n=1 Tax=Ditylenchus destructor TaxID=166010 RepID=A0AAD4MQE5_9BILA|nr:hypothetical protein DdX_14896 [Ditylenchus destructor]